MNEERTGAGSPNSKGSNDYSGPSPREKGRETFRVRRHAEAFASQDRGKGIESVRCDAWPAPATDAPTAGSPSHMAAPPSGRIRPLKSNNRPHEDHRQDHEGSATVMPHVVRAVGRVALDDPFVELGMQRPPPPHEEGRRTSRRRIPQLRRPHEDRQTEMEDRATGYGGLRLQSLSGTHN